MVYTLRSDEPTTITLCNNDAVSSVLQNIAVLLATKKGTVPQYREFGLSMEYLDKPLNVAKTLMAAEISEAIERFEPRAKLLDFAIESGLNNGKATVILEVEINT